MDNKLTYEKADLRLILFESHDLIQTSGEGPFDERGNVMDDAWTS